MFPIRDTIPSRHPPIATWVLILINGVVFLFELTMPEPALEQFFTCSASCRPDTRTRDGRFGLGCRLTTTGRF
jgi:hypothetical protein